MSDFDESADVLAEILYLKRTVEGILEGILEINPDQWNLQVGGDEPGPIYVQGIQEDHGCLHIELVHETDAGRALGTREREFLEFVGWESPTEDIPNYWMFLEGEEWGPEFTSSHLVESLDRIYHAFDPLVTDGSVSVMPLDLAVQVMPDEHPTVAVKAPGADQQWEPVWRPGELEDESSSESAGGEVNRVRLAYPAPPNGMPLRDVPSMPKPTSLWVVIDDDFGPTNLVFTTETDTWTRRDGKWVPWDIDDESDDPRDRMEDSFQVHVDPPFIDVWDRGAVTTEMVELHGYTFSVESTPEGEFYVYTGPAIDYAAMYAEAEPATPGAAQQHGMPDAGWYPDPWRQAHLRWWDGTHWTGSTQ